ncbi:DUF5008 domain-containing protein [Niabella pedocola]|uniref:DUF5008 domain-containing protein n=1 Tax=Niabella pedocola TaxID=1752077 RepID=A0ABS8PNV8_9BACT|nr:DUF5008 domain-containing protein [Niabella pedocola]MCD2422686.1 DUF5008 domain-containing protein [Niabella pedocola]
MKKNVIFLLIICSFFVASCFKRQEMDYAGAYAPPFINSVGLLLQMPVPLQGQAGDTVRFKVAGIDTLLSINPALIEFYLNGSRATVKSVNSNDSTLTVIVPGNASSGASSMIIGDKQFYGPDFNITGWAWLDSTFNATTQKDEKGNPLLGSATNGPVWSVYYDSWMQVLNLFVCGGFTTWNGLSFLGTTPDSYHNNNIAGVIQLNPTTGTLRDNFYVGEGPNRGSTIYGMVKLTNFPGYLVYGTGFSSFGIYKGVNNMTRVYQNGLIDSVTTNVNNPDPENPSANIGVFVNFKGGFDGPVRKVFLDAAGRLISVGNFSRYVYNDYTLSTAFSVVKNYTYQSQVAATNQDGILDTSYNYDPYRTKGFGTNGTISDAVQLMNGTTPGSIIIGGNFTLYNNEGVGRIVMLDNNGKRNPAFNVGEGADGAITKITYNAVTQKLLVTGDFKSFNGVACPAGVVMLNTNGSISTGFKLGDFERSTANSGRLVNYAGQLSDGTVILSGAFERYRDQTGSTFITRQGFMILNPDGTLAANLNNTGVFNGTINDIFETTTLSGRKGVVIAGSFSLFDNHPVNNIIRIGLQRK